MASRGVVWSGRVAFVLVAVVVFMLMVRQCGPGGGVLRVATGSDEERATAIVEALNKAGVAARLVETRSAIASVEALAAGEADFALVPADVAWYAVNGEGIFEEKINGFSVVFPMELWRVCILVPMDSGVSSVAGLRGKRVVVGAPGSTVELTASHVLEACGLSFSDLGRAIRLTIKEGDAALRDGEADALFFVGSPGAPVLRGPYRGVPISTACVERLRERRPFYTALFLGADSVGPTQASATLFVSVILLARTGLAAEEVQAAASVLAEWAGLRGEGPSWSKRLAIPLHPGAKAYYDAQSQGPGGADE